jgi:hypothetical protein
LLAKVQGNPALQTAGRFGRQNAAPGTFATLTGSEPGESDVLSSMNGQLRTTDYGDMAPSEAMLKNYANACTDLRAAVSTLRRLGGDSLASLNQLLTRTNVQPIAAPSPALALPTCAPSAPTPRGRGRATTGH